MSATREQMTATGNAERYTDADVAERVRRTLGVIHVDPASCAEANMVVQAQRIITKEADGLTCSWGSLAHVFVNPPSQGQGDVRRWWLKLMREQQEQHVSAFVFLCFRIDAVQSMALGSQVNGLPLPHDFWRCEPIRRLSYRTPGDTVTRHAMHSSALFCGGDAATIERFREAFADVGPCLPPRHA